jgi:hypothetical protein
MMNCDRRWPSSLAPRNIEALKDRFYSIQVLALPEHSALHAGLTHRTRTLDVRQRRLATDRGLVTEAECTER